MGTRIQDTLDLADKFRDKINDLKAIAEAFRHGDLLVKNYNNFLTNMKSAIDSGDESIYTKQDFDDLLDMRNELFAPIMENMAFIQQFERYIPAIETIIPPFDEAIEMLGEKYYDEENNVYTYHVIAKVVILENEKAKHMAELDTICDEIVELVTKVNTLTNSLSGSALSESISTFYSNSKNAINSLTEETASSYEIDYTTSNEIIAALKNLL